MKREQQSFEPCFRLFKFTSLENLSFRLQFHPLSKRVCRQVFNFILTTFDCNKSCGDWKQVTSLNTRTTAVDEKRRKAPKLSVCPHIHLHFTFTTPNLVLTFFEAGNFLLVGHFLGALDTLENCNGVIDPIISHSAFDTRRSTGFTSFKAVSQQARHGSLFSFEVVQGQLCWRICVYGWNIDVHLINFC